MNLFTRSSPYYHLLKYLIFLLKHPVYLTSPRQLEVVFETSFGSLQITRIRHMLLLGVEKYKEKRQVVNRFKQTSSRKVNLPEYTAETTTSVQLRAKEWKYSL